MTNLLITAGPTREYIDPVRYVSNSSSGKMGYALAEVGKKLGYKVTLISGPVSINASKGIKVIPIETAKEMRNQCLKNFKNADIVIMTSAVCDYRPINRSKSKIKKTDNKINLSLVRNPDILKLLGNKKRKGQVLVGFSLETNNLIRNAKEKLISKKCDFMIANMPSVIGSDFSKVWFLSKDGKKVSIPKMRKEDLAMVIFSYILK